jgi:hypothetical protein
MTGVDKGLGDGEEGGEACGPGTLEERVDRFGGDGGRVYVGVDVDHGVERNECEEGGG